MQTFHYCKTKKEKERSEYTKAKQQTKMNFLIFDKEFSSANLINAILADFRHVTLITSHETLSRIPSLSKSFSSIHQVDISNANDVIRSLSQHERDPFDAILMFNVSLYSNFLNVLETVKRFKLEAPPVFLFFTNQQYEIDKNVGKLLNNSAKLVQWTIIICNEIDSSTATKYQIETKPDSKNQKQIASTSVLDFLSHEIKKKQYVHETIYIY